MSHIQDMNNRIRQNREQRPSNRAKFKENNRAAIHTKVDGKETQPSFKTADAQELESIKSSIREKAKIENRKIKAFYYFLVAFAVAAAIGFIVLMN
ncbi:hypothetical protein [Flagellimonas sp.]|uniref:hypothetical protein n=1 Tax=Flagellimonas sp. TaxID=2058762 RepID=UPI003B5AF54C